MLLELEQYFKLKINIKNSVNDTRPVILYGRAGCHPGLEGINIFKIKETIYAQVYDTLSLQEQEQLKEILFNTFEKSDNKLSFSIVDRSQRPPQMIFLSETITEDIIYSEQYSDNNSLKYYLDLKRPSHPGIFFDIQPARKWVFENSSAKKVLNLFAFTCPFSVCASAGGASLVINMDNNSNVLSRGRKNHILNKLDLSSVKFEKKDVMKSFGYINKKGPFDIIICDPPSLQKGSFNSQKEYPKLVRRLKEALSPSGTLMLCLNDPFQGFDFLEKIIKQEGLIETQRINPPEAFRTLNAKNGDKNRGLKIICTRLK